MNNPRHVTSQINGLFSKLNLKFLFLQKLQMQHTYHGLYLHLIPEKISFDPDVLLKTL